MNDDLRTRLRRLDPMPADVPVESATTPSSRQRLEKIMQTPIMDAGERTDDQPSPTATPRPRHRVAIASLAAAAAVAAVVVGAAVLFTGGDDGTGDVASSPPLELSLGEGDALASCLPFDVAVLATMSPAFAATATAVDDGAVTLDVDRWYAGDAGTDTVVLAAQPGMAGLIAGFDFEVGQQYLITAAEGSVNFCGYSGPATPEMTAAFDAAFGG